METLKRILMFIMGMIFYPFISGYIMLENIGFFNKIKQMEVKYNKSLPLLAHSDLLVVDKNLND